MPAKHIAIGEASHEAEKQGLRFLVDNLPDNFVLYSNAYVVDRGQRGSDPRSVVYEVDAIIVAPHGLFCVELKSYRGIVGGTDLDWFVPQPIKSPVGLNRKTSQVLKSALRRQGADAGAPYVLGLVFLSHASRIEVRGSFSDGRVHGRETILPALRDPASFRRLSGHVQSEPVGTATLHALDTLLRGIPASARPVRRIREFVLETPVEQTERYTEFFATNSMNDERYTLRVYGIDSLAPEEERKRTIERCKWEAQVLGRVGDHPAILDADAPFEDDAGICVPFEYFEGIALPTWLERHAAELRGSGKLDRTLVVFEQIAEAMAFAHEQGVVHRLLRPEVVRVSDRIDTPEVRVTGFELAKQLDAKGTAVISTLHDDRLRWAAPEILGRFSDAEPRSDQFGLGLLLAHLLLDRPLVDSTDALRKRGVPPRLRDANPFISQALDDVVQRMLALTPADRYPSVRAALNAVLEATGRRTPAMDPATPPALDPERLPSGTRIGTDYEIRSRLGEGGLSVVYQVKHIHSGKTRALKVARETDDAEAALQAEHEALQKLDHPNIVRPYGDLTRALQGRLAMVLDRVDGRTLAQLLDDESEPEPEPSTRRRYAEDLFGALTHLEERGVVHKDLKPDNLIVGKSGLTVIDFSLASTAPDELRVGTALYRDPALKRWSHSADRYAGALCLFELYARRHPFDDRAPMPNEEPRFSDDEIDPPGLAVFFRRALAPVVEQRYASAAAMRAAFVAALGASIGTTSQSPPAAPTRTAGDAPLGAAGLSGTALSVLLRAGLRTQGDLVARPPDVLRRLKGLGHKKLAEVVELRERLLRDGVAGPTVPAGVPAPPLWPTLEGHPTPVQMLVLSADIAKALCTEGYPTIGDVARAPRAELERAATIGPSRIPALIEALRKFEETTRGAAPDTLAGFFDRACQQLDPLHVQVLMGLYGLAEARVMQTVLAEKLGRSQPDVSRHNTEALERLVRPAIVPLVDHLDQLIDEQRGFLPLALAVDELERRWPAGTGADGRPFRTAGLVMMLVDTHADRFAEARTGGVVDDLVIVRPMLDDKQLQGFLREAQSVFAWPPKDPEPARASLRKWLPGYDLDPLLLVTRLFPDVRLGGEGTLFQTPVDPDKALAWLVPRLRLPAKLTAVRELVDHTFGGFVTWPEDAFLHDVFRKVPGVRLVGDEVDMPGTRSVEPKDAHGDPTPDDLRVLGRSPEEVAGERLRLAADDRRGFRLVVAAAGQHRAIASSVAHALGSKADLVSFEDALFRRIEPQIGTLAKAEIFKARMPRLEEAMTATLDAMLELHGRPDARVVIGEVGIWGVSPELAKSLVRRLYDATVGGTRGFWALVMPGVIREKQPLFDERTPVLTIDGTALPLSSPIPISP